MPTIKPKNWQEFQHYKKRSPPWIRLYKKLLDNRDFHRLPDASAALAIKLWLLASESDDHETGEFELDYEEIAWRCRRSEPDVKKAIKPLIDSGFFILDEDASTMLAGQDHDATPETETEKRQRRGPNKDLTEFNRFWKAHPRKVKKQDAIKIWKRDKLDEKIDLILADLAKRKSSEEWQETKFIPHPTTYLNQRRWEDEECGLSEWDLLVERGKRVGVVWEGLNVHSQEQFKKQVEEAERDD